MPTVPNELPTRAPSKPWWHDALRRVVFYNAEDPSDFQRSLFNPNSLTVSTSARWNKLDPIGAQGQPLQYGGTNNMGPVSVTLEYCYDAWLEKFGSRYEAYMRQSEAWFQSFLYAPAVGLSPRPLVMIWPNTMQVKFVLESMSTQFKRWDQKLRARDFSITLEGCEVPFEGMNASFAKSHGYRRAFPGELDVQISNIRIQKL